jgi:hypothetical protein
MKIIQFLLFFAVLLWYTDLSAQKMSIGFIYPAGAEMGTTTEIEIGGLNVNAATEVIISGDGIKTEIIQGYKSKSQLKSKNSGKGKLDEQSSPQLADRIGVRITVAKNAHPGLRDLRVQSANGISNKLSFEVGQYPNLLEQKGSTALKPMVVEKLPITLCGQIFPGEIDYFSFKAEKGMTLVASVKARTLVPYIADAVPGWFQPIIRLKNSKGREIGYNDDFRNGVDPVIITKIEESDNYTLSITDAIFRGRDDFNYRIELGEIPFLEYIYPCVGRIGNQLKLTVKGVNLTENTLSFKPTNEGLNEFTLAGKNRFISNSVGFYGLPRNSKIEYSPKESMPNLADAVVFDSISSPRQKKKYQVSALKNEKIAIEIKARRLGSLMDAKMILRDREGKKIFEADDVEDATQGLMTHHADPLLRFKAPYDGNYTLEVTDITGNYGTDCFYMIKKMPDVPDLKAFVSPANLTIPKGGTAIFRVDISSGEQKLPELDFEIKGLPKGFKTSSLQSQAGSKFWEISVTAPENAKEGLLSLEVHTQGQTKGKESTMFVQTATAADNMMQAFYYTHHIPAAGFMAEITPASPFSLHLSAEMEGNLEKPLLVNSSDSIVSFKVRIFKPAGFNETIDLAMNKKNPLITMDPTQVLPNETEKIIRIKINEKVVKTKKKGRFAFAIEGTVKGEVERKGKRSFQNALYREITPIIILQRN